jgi:hypothetical protein
MDVDENSQNLIRITHYINPHMFWYVHQGPKSTALLKLELQINEFYEGEAKQRTTAKYKPKTGEVNGAKWLPEIGYKF